jgi:lipocalin
MFMFASRDPVCNLTTCRYLRKWLAAQRLPSFPQRACHDSGGRFRRMCVIAAIGNFDNPVRYAHDF